MRLFSLFSLFILLLSVSISCFAKGFVTFNEYKENYPLLVKDISELEALSLKDSDSQKIEMLNEMKILKDHYDHISNIISLQSFYENSKINKWIHLEIMAKSLISYCELEKTKNTILCESGLEKMKTYALDSLLSKLNKEEVLSFIDGYLLQIKALSLVDSQFIDTFNANVKIINLRNLEKVSPKLTPKFIAKTKPIILRNFKDVSKIELSNKSFLLNKDFNQKEFGIVLFLIFIGVTSVAIFFRMFKRKQSIKNFYAKLYALALRNNVQMKVYGEIGINEVKIINKIQQPFLNVIYLSRNVSNKTQIKFKKSSKSLIFEVDYFTTRSIQKILDRPKEILFKESMETLRLVVEQNGGEIVFTNYFNFLGEIDQTSLLFSIPK